MKFSEWVLNKILANLHNNGFTELPLSDTLDTRTVVQDAFGYRYEIQVKLLSRIEGYNLDETAYKGIDESYHKVKADENR